MDKINNYDELIKKVNLAKENSGIDLSVEEDLSIAIMNLISLEEHFFFTAEKTGKDEYLELMRTVRNMRKNLLGMMIKKYEGEVWCISKHLLAASMRLIEVGTKMQSKGEVDSAKDMFGKSYELFSLFFALRFKMLTIPDIEKESLDKNNPDKPWTKEQIMSELLNCCKE